MQQPWRRHRARHGGRGEAQQGNLPTRQRRAAYCAWTSLQLWVEGFGGWKRPTVLWQWDWHCSSYHQMRRTLRLPCFCTNYHLSSRLSHLRDFRTYYLRHPSHIIFDVVPKRDLSWLVKCSSWVEMPVSSGPFSRAEKNDTRERRTIPFPFFLSLFFLGV